MDKYDEMKMHVLKIPRQLLLENNYIKALLPEFHDLDMPSPEGIFLGISAAGCY
jgi:hypothetical protein